MSEPCQGQPPNSSWHFQALLRARTSPRCCSGLAEFLLLPPCFAFRQHFGAQGARILSPKASPALGAPRGRHSTSANKGGFWRKRKPLPWQQKVSIIINLQLFCNSLLKCQTCLKASPFPSQGCGALAAVTTPKTGADHATFSSPAAFELCQ